MASSGQLYRWAAQGFPAGSAAKLIANPKQFGLLGNKVSFLGGGVKADKEAETVVIPSTKSLFWPASQFEEAKRFAATSSATHVVLGEFSPSTAAQVLKSFPKLEKLTMPDASAEQVGNLLKKLPKVQEVSVAQPFSTLNEFDLIDAHNTSTLQSALAQRKTIEVARGQLSEGSAGLLRQWGVQVKEVDLASATSYYVEALDRAQLWARWHPFWVASIIVVDILVLLWLWNALQLVSYSLF